MATVVVALDQIPPTVVSVNVVVLPMQTIADPVIADTIGSGLMVKKVALVSVPVAVSTVMNPVDAPAGTTVVIWVSLSITIVADTPLNATAVAFKKPTPVIINVKASPAHACVGEKLVMEEELFEIIIALPELG